MDAVFINIGANDAGFGDTVIECFKWGRCQNNREFVEEVEAKLATLQFWYRELALRLKRTVPADRVFITQYFDPTEPSIECQSLLYGSELRWAYDHVVAVLNENVELAAKTHGWNFVGGIAQAFRGRGYCSGKPLVQPLPLSLAFQGGIHGTMHPNWQGHMIYGDRIFEAVIPRISQ